MGLLKYIYFSQYFELKQKGSEDKGFLLGNILVATMFLFITGALYMAHLLSDSGFGIVDEFISDTFDIGSDRLNGRILGLVALLLIYFIVRFTIGTRKNYNKIISKFDVLPIEKQAKQAKLGIYIFSLVLFSSIFVVLWCLFNFN